MEHQETSATGTFNSFNLVAIMNNSQNIIYGSTYLAISCISKIAYKISNVHVIRLFKLLLSGIKKFVNHITARRTIMDGVRN